MPIVHVVNCKKGVGKVSERLNYVEQAYKTIDQDGNRYVTGIHCNPDEAFQEFQLTKRLYHKMNGRQCYHIVQSFMRGENYPPELVHKIGVRFIQENPQFNGFEVVVATHLDREHMHTHFIINSVSLEDGHKFHINTRDVERMMSISDRIAQEYGIPVLNSHIQRNKYHMSGNEERVQKKGNSWKNNLTGVITAGMVLASNQEEFVQLLSCAGYQVRWEENRKYITYTNPNGRRCRDIKLFDDKYLKKNMELEFEIRKNAGRDSHIDWSNNNKLGKEDILNEIGINRYDMRDNSQWAGTYGGFARGHQDESEREPSSKDSDIMRDKLGELDRCQPTNYQEHGKSFSKRESQKQAMGGGKEQPDFNMRCSQQSVTEDYGTTRDLDRQTKEFYSNDIRTGWEKCRQANTYADKLGYADKVRVLIHFENVQKNEHYKHYLTHQSNSNHTTEYLASFTDVIMSDDGLADMAIAIATLASIMFIRVGEKVFDDICNKNQVLKEIENTISNIVLDNGRENSSIANASQDDMKLNGDMEDDEEKRNEEIEEMIREADEESYSLKWY